MSNKPPTNDFTSSGEGRMSLMEKLNRVFDPETTHVWQRWENEPDVAFERFCEYRDTPPSKRNLRQLSAKYDVNGSQVYRLSQEWKWRSRVAAWDKYRDDQKTKVEVSEIVAMRQRHARMARDLQNMVEDWIMEKAAERDRGIPTALTPNEAIKIVAQAVKLEIDSVDVESAEDNDLSALSSEELTTYIHLRQKIVKNNSDN